MQSSRPKGTNSLPSPPLVQCRFGAFLADRSECGWATVSAYVTDDLADTPEDERHISKAEKLAEKALDSKREKSRVKSGSANYKSNHASFSHVSNSRLGADDAVKSF